MKHFNYLLLILIILLFSCNGNENECQFRVKNIEDNLIDIKELNKNYKSGDIFKDINGEKWMILSKGEIYPDILYTDKLQYLIIDSTIKKTDTICINTILDTLFIVKHDKTLKTKYILK